MDRCKKFLAFNSQISQDLQIKLCASKKFHLFAEYEQQNNLEMFVQTTLVVFSETVIEQLEHGRHRIMFFSVLIPMYISCSAGSQN